MGEFKRGELHSGSSQGPTVRSRPQAIAIALSEQRKSDSGGYSGGGMVVGGMRRGQFAPVPSTEKESPRFPADGKKVPNEGADDHRTPPPAEGVRARDGGLIQHRQTSGRYANGGMVVHAKSGGTRKGLSEAAKGRFAQQSKGRMAH